MELDPKQSTNATAGRASSLAEVRVTPADWQRACLSELALQFFSGGTPSTKVASFWNGSIPWTTSAYIDRLYIRDGVKRITSEGLASSSSKIVPAGNLLIGTRVGVGKVAINTVDLAISQDLTGMVLDRFRVTPEFVAYSLMTDQAQDWFRTSTRGTTIKGVPRDDLLRLNIAVPPLPEQRAIAQILRTVQRAREATEAVIAATRELKKSLMRHLFTYGPVPVDQADQVSLKETEIGPVPEHWRVVTLNEISSGALRNGIFIKRPKWGSGLRYLNVADTYKSAVADVTQLTRIDVTPVPPLVFRVRNGEIVFVRSSLKREGVAMACTVPVFNEPILFDCHLIKVPIDTKAAAPRYVVEYCRSSLGHPRLIALSKSTTMTTIPQSNLGGFAMPLPLLAEQVGIANTLEALDRKLDVETQRRTALDALFKSLLEHLMTGRVRVSDAELQEAAEVVG